MKDDQITKKIVIDIEEEGNASSSKDISSWVFDTSSYIEEDLSDERNEVLNRLDSPPQFSIFEKDEESSAADQDQESGTEAANAYPDSSAEHRKGHQRRVSVNEMNRTHLEYLRDVITPQLLRSIKEESFEYGYFSKADEIIEEQMKVNALATKEWFNQLFIKYFDKPAILVGILRVIGGLDEEMISPQGPIIMAACIRHKNLEVQECCIRAFENWVSVDSLRVLKNLEIDNPKWMREYIDAVIRDLESELCLTS